MEELIGSHTRLLKSGRHEAQFYAQLWETVTRGDTWSGTIVNQRKDGTLYDEEQTIAPVLDDSGAITHFIAIKQDVSVERRTQQALARASAQLAEKVTEIEELNGRLREQASRDPLTGLYNRRFLEQAVGRDLARAARSSEPLAVALLDVDHFKGINDQHGHAAGDRVLQALAALLRARVRPSDLVCRIGGEEFLVVLPDTGLAVALARAESWRAAFATLELAAPEARSIRATVSIGVALHHNGVESFDESLGRADAALYRAKAAGRDRSVRLRVNAHTQACPPIANSIHLE